LRAGARRAGAGAQRRQDLIELAAATLGGRSFGRELEDRAADDPPADFERGVRRRVGDLVLALADGALPFQGRRPVERGIGCREVRRASRDLGRVEQVGPGKRLANSDALVAVVLVAGVLDGVDPGGGADRLKVEVPPAQKRPHERERAARRGRNGTHGGEALDPRPAR
jgi:hypothetical protein